jgi:hypothetical protein
MIVAELVEDGVVRRGSGGFGWRRTDRLPALDCCGPQRRGLAWSA